MASSAPTQVASAFWNTGDAQNTAVSLQASRTDASGSLFLFVTQRFCDAAADELVFRSFFANGELAPQQFTSAGFKGARLSLTTSVNGSEQRAPGCASPDWNNMTFANLGASAATVQATWVGTGDVYEVQPGITGRKATATGSIAGAALNPGSLGTAQFAELRSVTQQ